MKSYLKAFIKLIISAAALYYVFTKIDIREVLDILQTSNYFYLFIALLFFILSKLLSAWRLNYYFESIGIKLEGKSNLKLYLLGMYYNLFLPGGIGGDGYKIWLLNKRFSIKVKDLFWGVMLDRVNGVLALIILSLILVPFLNFQQLHSIIAISLIPISLICYLVVNYIFFKKFYKVITPTTILSFGVQILQLISALFIILANQSLTAVTGYLFVFLISSIVAILPITIGGIGSREITFLFGAQSLGLDIHLSIALSLLFYLITMVVSLGGIYYSLKPDAINLLPASGVSNQKKITL